ncbi:MAG: hypothetical protein WC412_05040 [Candidatus Omnitrophota bacterium]|jgi:hypothetical protein
MKKRISKLGLLLVILHSITITAISFVDAIAAVKYGCSNPTEMLLSVMIMDCFAVLIVGPIGGVFYYWAPISLQNIIFWKSLIAILFLIFGGMQWYLIGWGISKLKQKFFTRSKVKR